jgi:CRP/FNR family transcriptional regulator, cyclic AMP receptor protein
MLKSDEARTLRWIEGFSELSPSEIGQISSQCQWRWYEPHERIVSQEDTSSDVFFIVQGRVRITNYSTSGKEVSFRDLGVGEIFGELAAIDGSPRSASVVAFSDTLLASLSAKIYWQLLQKYPALTAGCLRRLARLIRALSDRVVEFASLSVRDRIYVELLRLAVQRTGTPDLWEIRPMPTHADLSNRVATHREAVTRVLHRLELDGVVRRDGKNLVLSDRESLRRRVFENKISA